jgi:hypothetical protein
MILRSLETKQIFNEGAEYRAESYMPETDGARITKSTPYISSFFGSEHRTVVEERLGRLLYTATVAQLQEPSR